MLETDADRLASIKGLGGQLIHSDAGDLWAIFDEAGSLNNFDQARAESTSPQLTARTSDVERLNLGGRAASVTLPDGRTFLIRVHQRGDAPGWSVLILDET